MTREKGITLIELLVATAVSVSLFLAVSYQLSQMSKSKSYLQSRSACIDLLSQLVTDIQAQFGRRYTAPGSASASFSATANTTAFVTNATAANQCADLSITELDPTSTASPPTRTYQYATTCVPISTSANLGGLVIHPDLNCPTGQVPQVSVTSTAVATGAVSLLQKYTQTPGLYAVAVCFRQPSLPATSPVLAEAGCLFTNGNTSGVVTNKVFLTTNDGSVTSSASPSPGAGATGLQYIPQ